MWGSSGFQKLMEEIILALKKFWVSTYELYSWKEHENTKHSKNYSKSPKLIYGGQLNPKLFNCISLGYVRLGENIFQENIFRDFRCSRAENIFPSMRENMTKLAENDFRF